MPLRPAARLLALSLTLCVMAANVACQRTPTPPPAAPAPAPVQPIAPGMAVEPVVETSEEVVDWELPGTLGPLTTQLELEQRFGKANVREETFDGPEGDGSYPALVLFPDDAKKRLELVLDAENPDAPIRQLRVSSPETLWHDASGLRPGMTLAELAALNGAPISFYGLDWDYGGTVQNWHGGTLANATGDYLHRSVSLVARANAGDGKLPIGDGIFRNDDPAWPGIGKDMVVGEIGISWPHEGEE